MKKIFFLVLVLSVLFTGCIEVKRESSDILYEKATVADLVYTPSTHGSGVSPTINMNMDLGISFTSVDVEERYAVVFQCQHGKFIIQNDQKQAKALWSQLKQGQEVTVSYKEEFETTYDDEKPIARKLLKYDFLDAK
jgi:hypothetical protein